MTVCGNYYVIRKPIPREILVRGFRTRLYLTWEISKCFMTVTRCLLTSDKNAIEAEFGDGAAILMEKNVILIISV